MKNRQLSLIFFLIIQLYIYVMLICFNEFINAKILSFISIFLCLIIGFFMFCKTKDYFIMIISVFITLVSDLFIIFFNDLHNIGLFLLNIVQILYFLRTYIDSDYKKRNLLTRCIAIPIGILISSLFLKEKIDSLSILWVIYIINLFVNIIFTIKEIGLNNLFPIGMLILLIHGTLMMFLSIENYTLINIPFISFLQELPFDVKTMFYLPAEVVLTCSIFTVNRRCFSKIKKDSEN